MGVELRKTQEAYIVSSLVSYTRRYWRKALKRKTETTIARALISVLKPNPRRARASCRKEKPKGQLDTKDHIFYHLNIPFLASDTYIGAHPQGPADPIMIESEAEEPQACPAISIKKCFKIRIHFTTYSTEHGLKKSVYKDIVYHNWPVQV